MSKYLKTYQEKTGKILKPQAIKLDKLFDHIEKRMPLPARGQQAVNLGFTAHTLNDSSENPEIYKYYHWVINYFFKDKPINELSSNLIGTSIVTANLIETNLPQPITLNPWQMRSPELFKINSKKVIIIENNGVFIWLYKLHPDWPLINQSGNDFNKTYNDFLRMLTSKNIEMTYLGDLDSEGMRIADHLSSILHTNLFSIQTPERVLDWLVRYGKGDSGRTTKLPITNKVLLKEMESISALEKFVEQEQLISDYEQYIPEWLKK